MAKKPELKWTANVMRGDEVIPYNSLSEEEKDAQGIRTRKAGIRAVANARGCEVEFHDPPPDTVTA